MPLRRLLIDQHVASASQVEEASARRLIYGGDFITNLYEVASPDEASLARALAQATGLAAGPPGALLPSEQAFQAISAQEACTLQVVPLGRDALGTWLVAVAESPSESLLVQLRARLGGPCMAVVVPYLRLAEALADLYGAPLPRRVARALLRLNGHASSAPPASTPFADWVQGQTGPLSEAPRSTPMAPDSLRVLQSAGSNVQRPRRRGPITLSFLRAELEHARSREDVLDLFFEFSAPFFEFSALWLLHGETAEGYTARSFQNVAPPTIAGTVLPLRGVLRSLRELRAGGIVMPAWSGEDADLSLLTRRNHGHGALLVPIVVAGRAVAAFYGDDSEGRPDLQYVGDIHAAAPFASAALERLILARRAGTGAAQTRSELSVPPPPRMPSRPAMSAVGAPSSLARQPAPPPPSVGRPGPPPPPSMARPGPPPPPASVARPAAPAPPPASVARPQAAPEAPAVAPEAPASVRRSAPPLSRASFHEHELPSMIIDVGDPYTPLVSRALQGEQEAQNGLLQAGLAALPALIATFPGPCIEVNDSDTLPKVHHAGIVPSLLLRLGDGCASSVAPYLEDSDEPRRFWATMMFTELCHARTLDALCQRAADSSARVRRAGVAALRRAAREVPKGVVDSLSHARAQAHDREEVRRALVFALGETGAALAVPALVDALADSSDDVVQTAHHALRRLTFQDFGRDPRRWVGWARNALGRHAIEWMMDGVLSESGEVRRHAASEFQRATGVQLELPADAGRAQIETLYDQLYSWWNNTGRAQFGGQP